MNRIQPCHGRSKKRWPDLTLIALVVFLLCTALVFAEASGDPVTVAAALNDLKRDHESFSGQEVAIATVQAMNERFFHRVDVGTLTPQQLADLARLNAFAYGDEAHRLALQQIKRLDRITAQSDVTGALAAALRVELAKPANADSAERPKWRQAFLHHPSLAALLQSEYGDYALDTAMSSVANEADREIVLGLVPQLDASKSTAAAVAVRRCWDKIVKWVPPGERRETLRRQLADYLARILDGSKNPGMSSTKKSYIENILAMLNGASARGQLRGSAAPEIHFDWSSQPGIKTLADLRGKVVVLDFWATWCSGCVASFPNVAQLVERYRDTDVVFVGVTAVQGMIVNLHGKPSIDCRGNPEKEKALMTDYIKEHGITWPVVFSREPLLNPDYGLNGVPAVVLIAPDGVVRDLAEGFNQAKETERIDQLLEEFKLRKPKTEKS